MLRNKYFIMVVGVLLLAVVAYNYSFFRSQQALQRSPVAERISQATGQGAGTIALAEPFSAYQPAWRRDPFWYPGGVDTKRHTAITPSSGPRFNLEGTITKNGKGYALINGDVYGVGDTVNGITIVEVGDQLIRIHSSAGTITVRITNDLLEKEK